MTEVDWIEKNLKVDGSPFILDDYQVEILKTDWKRLETDRESIKPAIINKSRQIGVTTLLAANAIFKCMYVPGWYHVITSKDDRNAKHVVDMVSRFMWSFPKEIHDVLIESESQVEYRFLNGSRIVCMPCNPDAVRGFTPDEIDADEFAFFNEKERDNDLRFMAAAVPALSVIAKTKGTGFIKLVSTPNGKKGYFFQEWFDNDSIFDKIAIHWSRCKRLYGSVEKIKATLPQPRELYFRQEFCNSFEENMQGFIDRELLMRSVDDGLRLEWE
jgi:phage FluMu gp28-like protein